jgi:beta-1,2-mannobiose phosphorylase / 1,2-beta-oligomannan phosphorylase
MNGEPNLAVTHDFRLVRLDELTFDAGQDLASMYKLSPFVWRENGTFDVLLRVVNRDDDPSKKVARIHHGTSSDGVHFTLGETPVIAPGPNVPGSYDSGGCEDPTVACVDGISYVYYSGWNEHLTQGQLLLATGPDVDHLTKRGIALESSERARNPKEATIAYTADGTWRLFFEFAQDDRSKIGIATSPHVDGPWEVLDPLFEAREDGWDSWHLSTGPVVAARPDFPVMFYNGATRAAEWRIGWVVFDAGYTRVVARSRHPIVLPHIKRNDDDTNIAFAASAIDVDCDIHLYYSVADQYCTRAIIRAQ